MDADKITIVADKRVEQLISDHLANKPSGNTQADAESLFTKIVTDPDVTMRVDSRYHAHIERTIQERLGLADEDVQPQPQQKQGKPSKCEHCSNTDPNKFALSGKRYMNSTTSQMGQASPYNSGSNGAIISWRCQMCGGTTEIEI